jgi:hypothetical protein
MISLRGVLAEVGRAGEKGDCGGSMTWVDLVQSAVFGASGIREAPDPEEQLLDREEAMDLGDSGLDWSEAAEATVLAIDPIVAVVATESEDCVEVMVGFSTVKLPLGKLPARGHDAGGLATVGESFARKSRYAAGGVTGVFWASSRLIHVGVDTIGLRISEGYVADIGVRSKESLGFDVTVVAMMEDEKMMIQTRGPIQRPLWMYREEAGWACAGAGLGKGRCKK